MVDRCLGIAVACAAALAGCAPAAATSDAEGLGRVPLVEPEPSPLDLGPQPATRTGFVPPAAAERVRALGRIAGLSEELQRAFTPTAAFEPLLPPQPGEWLAEHYEPGQSYREFAAAHRGYDEQRDTIYLVRLGPARSGSAAPPMATLARFVRAYFDVEVEALPELAPPSLGRSRPRGRGPAQLYTEDLLDALEPERPVDGMLLFAITERDLYPRADWAFTFGEASRRRHVGIESLVRFDPAFHGIQVDRDAAHALATRRALTVLTHEIGHLFGLKHCTFFRCVMGGGSDLRELDGAPLHLCPVCLRKLHRVLGFDPARRYQRLQRFYRELGIDDEAQWVADRAAFVRGRPSR